MSRNLKSITFEPIAEELANAHGRLEKFSMILMIELIIGMD